jgi:hypothetical protein
MKEHFFFTHPGRGLAAWIVITLVWWQPHLDEPRWIMPLLFFAALFLMPFSHALQRGTSAATTRDTQVEVFCAFMLVLSFAQDEVLWAVVLTLPWLVWRVWWAVGSVQTLRHAQWTVGDLASASAGVFPVIGALWLTLHQTNWRLVWNFDPLIVMLTAAHFHHAGFTLPLMAGLNAKARPGCWTRFSCVAILLGVPLVAIGITCTHFGVLPFVEPFGVTVLVLGSAGRGRFADSKRLGKGKRRTGAAGVCRLGRFLARRDAFGARFRPSLCFPESGADDAADVGDPRDAERVWLRRHGCAGLPGVDCVGCAVRRDSLDRRARFITTSGVSRHFRSMARRGWHSSRCRLLCA